MMLRVLSQQGLFIEHDLLLSEVRGSGGDGQIPCSQDTWSQGLAAIARWF